MAEEKIWPLKRVTTISCLTAKSCALYFNLAFLVLGLMASVQLINVSAKIDRESRDLLRYYIGFAVILSVLEIIHCIGLIKESINLIKTWIYLQYIVLISLSLIILPDISVLLAIILCLSYYNLSLNYTVVLNIFSKKQNMGEKSTELA